MSNIHAPELFSEEKALWESIVAKTAETFRLSELDAAALQENQLLRMFGLLPYFAECPNCEGIGLLNVSIYLTERLGGREWFLNNGDHELDYLRRLQPFRDIMNGGNEEVIEKGLTIAGLVMLKDYLHDQAEDAANGKYNPLNSGSWDYDSARQNLEARMQALPAHRLDSLGEAVIQSYVCWLLPIPPKKPE